MIYKTKQKDQILNIIKSFNHEFTVKEVYDSLEESIGLTTIYRMVDKLVSEGVINKSISKDNITFYQYLGKCEHENHFYLKCEKCNKLEHVDCDCIINLWNHIIENHKFTPSKDQIIINGICTKCSRKEERVC